MTVAEMKSSRKPFLTPADVAEILECNPHSIRVAAKENPDTLGFPVTVLSSRVRIPRIPFLRYIGECGCYGETDTY